jgi:hypothetical protein
VGDDGRTAGAPKFSIAKHGERKALTLAKRARGQGEQARLKTPR